MARSTAAAAKRRKPNPTERRATYVTRRSSCWLTTGQGAEPSQGGPQSRCARRHHVVLFPHPLGTAARRGRAIGRAGLASLQSIADSADGPGGNPSPSRLAQVVIQAGSEPQLSRTKARYELTMQAARDPAMAAILQQATDGFTRLHSEILVHLIPHAPSWNRQSSRI